MLLPGGATETGMTPDDTAEAARQSLPRPEVMCPPVLFLASPEAAGVTGERIVARDFDAWLAAFGSRPRAAG